MGNADADRIPQREASILRFNSGRFHQITNFEYSRNIKGDNMIPKDRLLSVCEVQTAKIGKASSVNKAMTQIGVVFIVLVLIFGCIVIKS